MRMRIVAVVLLVLIQASAKAHEQSADPAAAVVPVDWSKFKKLHQLKGQNQDLLQSGQLLLNAVRCNVAWVPSALEKIKSRPKLSGREAHDLIRPACSVVYALAVVLKTGLFDEKVVGITEARALDLARNLSRELISAHERRRSWDYPWQSALWAGLLGHGVWILWDEFDAESRRRLVALIEHEADRFMEYQVPYWTGRPDDGDTKAEENSWNSMILQVAIAMMPAHPHVATWKEKCSELMVSAYSLKKDLENPLVLDGKPVKAWLKGYNVREDGAVINHGRGFVHPDYMVCITLQLRGYLTQSLAGRPVPETTDFNADFMYRTFVAKRWESPPFQKPGGTIYVPGEAVPYYPMGTDWSRLSLVNYYLMDSYAHTLGMDVNLPRPASEWLRIRAKRLQEMQGRHADGHLWAEGEYNAWVGREQTAARIIGDGFLLQWLAAQGKLSKKSPW